MTTTAVEISKPLDELGPVDFVIVEFPAGHSSFTGEMAKELLALVDAGTGDQGAGGIDHGRDAVVRRPDQRHAGLDRAQPADSVAKASDDHTLAVVINGNLTSAKLLNPKLPYDPAKDFSLVSLIATAPLGLRMTKEGLAMAIDAGSLEAAMAIENRNQLMTAASPNFAEGMRAFLEKRRPDYIPD